ncbi:MAG: hypothetical protein ABFR75_09895 [Acidobacteriota bacterium]
MTSGILKKININLAVIFLLVFSVKYFQGFPFEKAFFKLQAIFIVGLISFGIAFVLLKLLSGAGFRSYELYILLLSLLIPIYSAFRAFFVFGQPVFMGFLKERIWFTTLSGLLILYMLKIGKWKIQNILSSFLFISWVSLIGCYLLYVFGVPSGFEGSFINFSPVKGIHYRIDNYFIVFGFLYYLIKSIKFKRPLLIFNLFLYGSYLFLLDKGRGMLVCVFLTTLAFIFNKTRFGFRNTVVIILVMILAFFSLYVFMGSNVTFFRSFGEIISLFDPGKSVSDNSIAARIFQFNKIKDTLYSAPGIILLGSGFLSNRWNNGFSGELDYFFPTDMGIVGVWFVYGIIGAVIIFFQLFIVFRFRESDSLKNNETYLYFKYFFLFMVFKSILTGVIAFNPATFVIPGVVIYWFRSENGGINYYK